MPLPARGQITTSRLEAWETPPGALGPVVIARMDWQPQGPAGRDGVWVLSLLPNAHESVHHAVLGLIDRDGRFHTTAETVDDARLVLQAATAATIHVLERIRDAREAFHARLEVAARSAGQQSLDL